MSLIRKKLVSLPNKSDLRLEPVYSDLPKDLRKNPVNDDIAPLYDEVAINEALRNLILTNRGEYLFQPNKGVDLKSLLFSNLTPMLIEVVKNQIESAIRENEPRVRVLEVLVGGEGTYTLSVRITYEIPTRETPISTTIFLERKR